jgi:uncharacterized surface protein with fasciclin (FAS1) repeats
MRINAVIVKSMAVLALMSVSVACSEDDDDDDTATLPADVVAAAQATPSLSTLASLVAARPAIAEALKGKDLTVFAPTNAAFEAAKAGDIPADVVTSILQYHVVSSAGSEGILASELTEKQAPATLTTEKVYVVKNADGVKVNGSAKVTTADVRTANGSVIHIIDAVLIPDAIGTVVSAVTKRYDLTSLAGAVVSQNLVEALSDSEGTFTVFAPTNAAFTALGTLPTGDALTSVLQYHVLGQEVKSTAITAAVTAGTLLAGKSITAAPESGKVKVTDSTSTKAEVTEADIVTSNGVIHIIDKVLIPGS